MGGSGPVPKSTLAHSHMLSTRAGSVVQARLCDAPVMAQRERRAGKRAEALSVGGVPGSTGHTALGW